MDKYHYTVNKHADGVHINLVAPDGRLKQFFQAGDIPVEPLAKHMDSLTDLQCGDWFKTKE